MVSSIKKQLTPTKFKEQELHKSAGILDDFAVRKNIASREGTVEKVPVNENDITNKEYVDSLIRGNVKLFLTEDASDIGTYFDLATDSTGNPEENIAQAITGSGTTLIASFASILSEAEIESITDLEQGIYSMHLHAEANFPQGMTMYFEFYRRTSLGVETLLGTSHDSDTLSVADAQYELHASITSDLIWNTGDRVVVKVYGRNSNSPSKTITIHVEGDTLSRVAFPAFIPPTAASTDTNYWLSGAVLSPITPSQGISGAYLDIGGAISGATLAGDGSRITGLSTGTTMFSNWGTLSGAGLSTISGAVVFDSSFTGIPDITANCLGYKNGTPSDRGDVTAKAEYVCTAQNPSTTGFTVVAVDVTGAVISDGGTIWDITANQKAHYKLNDDAANTTIADSSGEGNNGTMNGGNTVDKSVAGKIDKAIDFDGTGDFIVPTSNIVLGETSSFALWFNTDTVAAGKIILGKAADNDVYTQITSATTIAVQPDTGGQAKTFTVPTLSTGTWYHLIVVRTAQTTRLYINNVESTSGGQTLTGNYTVNRIGRYSNSTTNDFNGRMDDIRLFPTHALTSAERTGIYNGGSGTEDDSLVGVATQVAYSWIAKEQGTD